MALRQEEVAGIEGTGPINIVFEHGSSLERRAMFMKPPQHQESALSTGLGCDIREDGRIIVGDDGRTSAHGVYAAGDLVAPAQQLIIAAASGAQAAISIQKELSAEVFG